MGDRPVHPSEIRGPIKIVCKNCGEQNPAKAYCCLKCFKILRPKAKGPLASLSGNARLLIVFGILAILVIVVLRSWIGSIQSGTTVDPFAVSEGEFPVPPLPAPAESR